MIQDFLPIFNKIKDRIIQAIDKKQPIIIRHHADADGYCAAIALERAILKHLHKRHTRESSIYYHYHRAPSRTPFYDYTDAQKDLTQILNNVRRHDHNLPLIICVDLGSSEENIQSYHLLKTYNIPVIVIDHHPPHKEVPKLVELHCNSHDFTDDYSWSAGMLCAEIGKLLWNDLDFNEIAAIAGISDKISGAQIEHYVKACGKSHETLRKLGEATNYLALAAGYQESRYLFDDILGADQDKQAKLLAFLDKEIHAKQKAILPAVEHFTKTEQINNTTLLTLDIDTAKPHSFYPNSSRVLSLALQKLQDTPSFIALGYGPSFCTFRASKDHGITFHDLLNHIKSKIPYALAAGGGHPQAGSMHFQAPAKQQVLEELITFIKSKLK